MAWTNRADRPADQRGRASTRSWRQLRARVLDRDGHRCTATRNGVRCDRAAGEVDHIINVGNGGVDDETNLASLCAAHHQQKTQAEAAAARRRYSNKRPQEPHPGLR